MNGAAVVEPAHWYATLPTPSLAGAVGEDLGVVLRRYRGTHTQMEKPALAQDLICVHQGGPKRVHRWQGGTHRSWAVEQDAISLMPRCCANRWRTEGTIAFTHLTLGSGLLSRVAREEFDRDPRALAVADKVGVADPLLVQLIETLAGTLRSTQPVRLYREALLTALVIRVLVRHSSAALPEAGQTRGGLAGWQLRRVLDYMQAHLAEEFGSAELFGLVGLSRAQFFRAFRQSTGQTPGRTLRSLRLDRARTLLASTSGTLDEVAHAVGFRDAQSFARSFGRSAGVSPAVWRRAQRRSG